MDQFNRWVAALEARHLASLTFPEVSRALRALSATYVERRQRLTEGAALAGAGKRAAFALFYGPLHFLLVRHVVMSLPGALAPGRGRPLVDLGCGTGASGAAWASVKPGAALVGIDRHPWTLTEAKSTYRAFGLPARTVRSDIAKAALPDRASDILAGFVLNELAEAPRTALLTRLLGRVARGDRLLIVEPLAGFVAPWWSEWAAAATAAGGRADEWRIRVELPAIVAKLDRAAGLDHRELKGRSLWIPGA